MELDEVAARLVKQYWALIAACVIVPVLAIGLITYLQPASYAAYARIITGGVVPASSAQADAVVSQVQGIATGRAAVARALSAAGVSRNLNMFIASDISVTGLGTSQVVNLTVTDPSPQVATTVARVLASEVVTSINHGLSAALQDTDREIVQLTEQHSQLALEAARSPQNLALQAKLAGLNEVIANFSADRSRLLIQAGAQGQASVIDSPARPNLPESKALPQKAGLAAVLGLVVAILISAIAEMVRPTVPGARRVGSRVGAPTLGQLNNDELSGATTPGLANMALRLQLAAAHAGVHSIALVDIDSRRQFAGLAHGLERAMAESPPGGAGLPVTVAGNHMNAGGTVPAGVHAIAGEGGVGLVVLCGPVTRVSRIAALEDLVTSSGWQILGVVAVPRLRRKQVPAEVQSAIRPSESAGNPANEADPNMRPKVASNELA